MPAPQRTVTTPQYQFYFKPLLFLLLASLALSKKAKGFDSRYVQVGKELGPSKAEMPAGYSTTTIDNDLCVFCVVCCDEKKHG
jgi:hypothetical protein